MTILSLRTNGSVCERARSRQLGHNTSHLLSAWQREVSRWRVRVAIADETCNQLQDASFRMMWGGLGLVFPLGRVTFFFSLTHPTCAEKIDEG
jgi:hypothetical protein